MGASLLLKNYTFIIFDIFLSNLTDTPKITLDEGSYT